MGINLKFLKLRTLAVRKWNTKLIIISINDVSRKFIFQIDETVDLDKQSYIVDKDQTDDENETGEGDKVNYADADDDKEENDISSENEGEIKLENLKENLNKEEEPLV